MKLYTEADMIQMYNAGCDTAFTGYGDADIALERFTPIELPSDDDMKNKAKHLGLAWEFYYKGAKWVIEQIEQQADGIK